MWLWEGNEVFRVLVSHPLSKDADFLLHSFSCSGYGQSPAKCQLPSQASRYCSYRHTQGATEDFCCLLQNPCCTFGAFQPLPVSLAAGRCSLLPSWYYGSAVQRKERR